MLEQLAATPLSLALASERMVDALFDAGSRRIGKDLQRPNGVLVWPMRELLSQRRTVATATAQRLASTHVATEYRGITNGSLDDWIAGAVDWTIVAGIQWRRLDAAPSDAARQTIRGAAPPVLAELCGVLYDRRTQWPVARFVQRLDPASLNLTPTPFSLDQPLIPRAFQVAGAAMSGDLGAAPGARQARPAGSAVIGPWICDPAIRTVDAASGQAVVTPVTTATLTQAAELERGIGLYEAQSYQAAAQAFARAIENGGADVEMLAGWAMASDRLGPQAAGPAWDRLADVLLDQGRLTVVASPSRMASQGRRLVAAVADNQLSTRQLRQSLTRRANAMGSDPIPPRMWLQLTASLGTRLQDRGQCAAIIPHQDLRERNAADPVPANERAALLSAWMTAAGRLTPTAIAIDEARGDAPIVGTATADLRDAWNRRLDIVTLNCAADSAPGRSEAGPDRSRPALNRPETGADRADRELLVPLLLSPPPPAAVNFRSSSEQEAGSRRTMPVSAPTP